MVEDTSEIYSPTDSYEYSYDSSGLKTLNVANSLTRLRSKVAPLRFKLAARNISQELRFQGGENILEVGSGLGLLGKAVNEETDGQINYYGVDLAFNSATKSRRNSITPMQTNAINLPFKDNTFDAIISTDVLEHIRDDSGATEEIKRVLKPGGKAFLVIADPSEGRFADVHGHIDRTGGGSNVEYWENLFKKKGLEVLQKESQKYRSRDWRSIFNLPFLVHLKNKPGFACAFNPVNRPGTYIIKKPEN